MPRKPLMSWDANKRQWQKMYKGRRYRVSCSSLPIPESLHSKEGSYLAANEWWEKTISEIEPAPLARINTALAGYSFDDLRRIASQGATVADLLATLPSRTETPAIGAEDVDALADDYERTAFYGVDTDPAEDAASRREMTATRVATALAPRRKVRKGMSVESQIVGFLAICKGEPATLRELNADLRWLAGLADDAGPIMPLTADVETITEETVRRMNGAVERSDLAEGSNTRKKRWGFFRRFVTHLAEERMISCPANLHAKKFRFKGATAKKVARYSLDTIRDTLAAMPELPRLWALLGLNASMTNVDIADLSSDMIEGDLLTRKRVKGKNLPTVPTVDYRLWPETLALLAKYKSKHRALWFTSTTGTPMYEWRTNKKGERVKKDLVGKTYTRLMGGKPSVLLCKFRAIGSTMIRDITKNDSITDLFLCHAPTKLIDKNYAASMQADLDNALVEARKRLFGTR